MKDDLLDFYLDTENIFSEKLECAGCGFCDLAKNLCKKDKSKCYERGIELHPNCKDFNTEIKA